MDSSGGASRDNVSCLQQLEQVSHKDGADSFSRVLFLRVMPAGLCKHLSSRSMLQFPDVQSVSSGCLQQRNKLCHWRQKPLLL